VVAWFSLGQVESQMNGDLSWLQLLDFSTF